MVGYHEYQTAIGNFESLVENSTPQEIAAYDQIIKRHEELAFYMQVKPKVIADKEDPTAVENEKAAAKRHGLSWMMGLARVEVASMLRMFAPDVKQPYTAVLNSRFGSEEYVDVLREDSALHLQALSKDRRLPAVAAAARKDISEEVLSYARRFALTLSLLEVSIASYNGEQEKSGLSDFQRGYQATSQEFQGLAQSIQQTIQQSKVAVPTGAQSSVSRELRTRYTCRAILNGISSESQQGTLSIAPRNKK